MDRLSIAAPAVIGAVVYPGDARGMFYALDAETGDDWAYGLGDQMRNSAAVVDGVV